MKIILFCLLCGLMSLSDKPSLNLQEKYNEYKKIEYAMTMASEDIQANIALWVQWRSEVDASLGEGWIISLGRKIPSQPIGVIEVISLTGHPVSSICSPPFIEPEDYLVDEWSMASINTLESFIMIDNKKERIRLNCLEYIKNYFYNRRFEKNNIAPSNDSADKHK